MHYSEAGFSGPVYPVNPNMVSIGGLTVYPTVAAIPQTVDLAIIAVPSDAVLGVIDDCANRQVRALVIITAGFAEVGNEGVALQHQLIAKVRGYGMRMVGPNCLGIINADPAVSLNATFSPLFPAPVASHFHRRAARWVLAVLAFARERQIGISNFVSVGNKADVSGK